MRSINQSGDTIVEVLIAIAIVGLVLTGAFKISNMSLLMVRSAQERSEAQKIAQESAEVLEQMHHDQKLTPATLNTDFCIDYDSLSTPPKYYPKYPAPGECLFGTNNMFYSVVQRQSATTYRITVTWSSLVNKTDNVTYYYKVSGL